MRKRIIDTDGLYFDTALVRLLGAKGLHLYVRLWGLAEDWGGFRPDYSEIALRMGALKFSSKEVERIITKLIEAGKVVVYESGSEKFCWLKNLLKHQVLNNPSPPVLPLPSWIECEIKKYPSGKKYAIYKNNFGEELPVGYRDPTSNSVTVTETETKHNGKETETETETLSPEDLNYLLIGISEKLDLHLTKAEREKIFFLYRQKEKKESIRNPDIFLSTLALDYRRKCPRKSEPPDMELVE